MGTRRISRRAPELGPVDDPDAVVVDHPDGPLCRGAPVHAPPAAATAATVTTPPLNADDRRVAQRDPEELYRKVHGAERDVNRLAERAAIDGELEAHHPGYVQHRNGNEAVLDSLLGLIYDWVHVEPDDAPVAAAGGGGVTAWLRQHLWGGHRAPSGPAPVEPSEDLSVVVSGVARQFAQTLRPHLAAEEVSYECLQYLLVRTLLTRSHVQHLSAGDAPTTVDEFGARDMQLEAEVTDRLFSFLRHSELEDRKGAAIEVADRVSAACRIGIHACTTDGMSGIRNFATKTHLSRLVPTTASRQARVLCAFLRVLGWHTHVLRSHCDLPDRAAAAFLLDPDSGRLPLDIVTPGHTPRGTFNRGEAEQRVLAGLDLCLLRACRTNTDVVHHVGQFLRDQDFGERRFVAEALRRPKLARIEAQHPRDDPIDWRV